MASPQAVSIMQSTGGALPQQPDAAVMCEAFRKAVDQWCAEEKAGQKHNGDFNDYFFRKLYNTPGGRSGALGMMRNMREMAFLNPRAAGAAATVLSASGGAVGTAFSGSAMTLAAGASSRGFRWGVILNFIKNPACWAQGTPMFPDAMLGNTPVEIKGPKDLLGTKQADKYQKIHPNGDLIVVSCQSCKASCAKTNNCP
ncbi:MAG: hypothetical protein R3B70_39045 [Polyangiaceae bacterium]